MSQRSLRSSRAVILVTGLGVGLAIASPAIADSIRGVIGHGATPASGAAGGGFVLRGTVGQPAVGASADRVHHVCHGFWCSAAMPVVSVDEPEPEDLGLPTTIDLGRPTPNPMRSGASFALALPRASTASLRVYDVQGRLVDTVLDRALDAGYHTVRWEPLLDAGIYFVRLAVNGVPAGERRVVVVR